MNDMQFDQIYAILHASFPSIERRTYADQKSLLDNPNYRLITKSDEEGHVIGFIAAWEFSAFRFVEHFAVNPANRGAGIGEWMMTDYLAQSPQPVILEVEPPADELKIRRIKFYERLGFRLNAWHYMQPALQAGMPDLPLQLMSYPDLLTASAFARCRETLYAEVYRAARDT